MLDKGQIKKVVYRAIDRVNELLLDEDALTKEETTILVGEGSKLDSMGFVNFVLALEEEFAQMVGLNLNVAEELNAAEVDSLQWFTVAELIDLLFVLVQKKHLQ
jgi:acyl carrier protein